MAILIKQLGVGEITSATLGTLYTAPNTSPNIRAAIVKGMRFVNTSATAVQLNVYVQKVGAADADRRRILPKNLSLAVGALLEDGAEITLDPGDRIRAEGEASKTIDWVLSGVERDAS